MANEHYLDRFNETLVARAASFLERNKEVLEPIRKRAAAAYGLPAGKDDLRFMVVKDKYGATYSARYSLSIGDHAVHLAAFTLDLYPACCALHTVNDYYCAYVDEKLLDDFFSTCRGAYMTTIGGTVRRVMFNFLETSRQDKYKPDDMEIPKDDASVFTYPEWHNWAMTKKNIMETRFVNHNTGRIIHNTIITL